MASMAFCRADRIDRWYNNLTLLSSLFLIWYKLFQDQLLCLSRDLLSGERAPFFISDRGLSEGAGFISKTAKTSFRT
jgi:hypothetical protein